MRNRKRRGSAMVEFIIAGIAGITLMISTLQLGLAMWNYHTLAQAVHEANRYAASHGRGCNSGGCSITVGNVTSKLKEQAIGVQSSNVNVTLTSNTVTKDCNPITACLNDPTQWPPNDNFDNSAGNYITISAKLNVQSAIVALWYGMAGQRISSITLTSASKIPVVF